MALFGLIRTKCDPVEDPRAVAARQRKREHRHELEQELARERGDLRNGIQVIQSHSRRLSAMANAMSLARENAGG